MVVWSHPTKNSLDSVSEEVYQCKRVFLKTASLIYPDTILTMHTQKAMGHYTFLVILCQYFPIFPNMLLHWHGEKHGAAESKPKHNSIKRCWDALVAAFGFVFGGSFEYCYPFIAVDENRSKVMWQCSVNTQLRFIRHSFSVKREHHIQFSLQAVQQRWFTTKRELAEIWRLGRNCQRQFSAKEVQQESLVPLSTFAYLT